MAAVAAGAHAGVLFAGARPAIPAKTTSRAPRSAARGTTRSGRIATTYPDRTRRKSAPEVRLSGLSRDVQQDSSRAHRDHERRPTEGDERQGNAGDRQDADDGADVDQGLADDPGSDPRRQQGAEAIGRLEGGAHAEDGEGDEQADHQQGAD